MTQALVSIAANWLLIGEKKTVVLLIQISIIYSI